MSVKHAVLGHLVQHPDYGYRLRAQLSEQLEIPDLSGNTVYRALVQLQKEGLIVELGADRTFGSGRDRVWFKATDKGSEAFEEWLRGASEEMPLLDGLHSKLLVSRPANLPELVELTWAQERACLARLGELEGAAQMSGEWRRSWEGGGLGRARRWGCPHVWPGFEDTDARAIRTDLAQTGRLGQAHLVTGGRHHTGTRLCGDAAVAQSQSP
jgi:DNA-binding PadR family transcriptional regulator